MSLTIVDEKISRLILKVTFGLENVVTDFKKLERAFLVLTAKNAQKVKELEDEIAKLKPKEK